MNGSVASEAGLPEFMPEMVVDARAGSVLFKGTILKSDHFPGIAPCHLGWIFL